MSGNPTNLEYTKCFLHYLKGDFPPSARVTLFSLIVWWKSNL